MRAYLVLSALLFWGACAAPTPLPNPSPSLALDTQNKIPNAGAEQALNPARPQDWTPDTWGEQATNLSWESTNAHSGSKYLSITSHDYKEGDAKWIFPPQPLMPHTWYEYTDASRSDGRSRLMWYCRSEQGQRRYRTIGQSHASETWQTNRVRFYHSGFPKCDISIMHVLDRNGYLHTDSHELRAVLPRPLTRPIVSIAFDDIYLTAAQRGASELEKRGWRGSYYVASDYARNTQAKYTDLAGLKQLKAAGHEIGSHSENHPALTRLDSTKLEQELKNSHAFLTKELNLPAIGLAYPFGDFDHKVEAQVKQVYAYARTSLVGLNEKGADPYRLKIVPVTKDLLTSELLAWIEDAEKTSTWLILLYHDLQDAEGEFEYTTSSTQYVQVLDYLKRRNLTVLPVDQALKETQQSSK